MPEQPERPPDERRQRWSRFMGSVVGHGKRVAIAALDRALKDASNREGDARGEIYAYLRGEQVAYKKRAFAIGEALQDLGIRWASGGLALFAADHLSEFIYALCDLAKRDLIADATIMALCAEAAVEGRGDARALLSALKRPTSYAERNLDALQVDVAFHAAVLFASCKRLPFDYRAARIAREIIDMIDHRMPVLKSDSRVMRALFRWETGSVISAVTPDQEVIRWHAPPLERRSQARQLKEQRSESE